MEPRQFGKQESGRDQKITAASDIWFMCGICGVCDYGAKKPSISVCWNAHGALPYTARFDIIPVQADETERAVSIGKIELRD